jgi:hypothetical protein
MLLSMDGWRFSVERFEVIDRIVFSSLAAKNQSEKNPCRNAKRDGKLQVISHGSHQATLNRLWTHFRLIRWGYEEILAPFWGRVTFHRNPITMGEMRLKTFDSYSISINEANEVLAFLRRRGKNSRKIANLIDLGQRSWISDGAKSKKFKSS